MRKSKIIYIITVSLLIGINSFAQKNQQKGGISLAGNAGIPIGTNHEHFEPTIGIDLKGLANISKSIQIGGTLGYSRVKGKGAFGAVNPLNIAFATRWYPFGLISKLSSKEYKTTAAYLEASLGHSFGSNLNDKLLNNGALKFGYLFNSKVDVSISPWTMYATRFNSVDYTVKFAQLSFGYKF